MNETGLKTDISARYQPFMNKILEDYRDLIHSIHIVGSALTEDYDPGHSDINSVVVLENMDLKFIKFLAPLGKQYGKQRIAAPLLMTPAYIDSSLDVFPIEFYNIQKLHYTIFGEDVFSDLEIIQSDMRRQCEQELKIKLMGLRQGFIAAAGDKRLLNRGFAESFSGYMPLFKSIILLLGQEPPNNNNAILSVLEEVSGVSTEVFKKILGQKQTKAHSSTEQLSIVFEEYYAALEKLGKIIDEIDS